MIEERDREKNEIYVKCLKMIEEMLEYNLKSFI